MVFSKVFPEKLFELKSLKRQTKAEEEGPRGYELVLLVSSNPVVPGIGGVHYIDLDR
jgi:hypothetical protein